MTDATAAPAAVDVLAILYPPRHRILHQANWKEVDRWREPEELPVGPPTDDKGELDAALTAPINARTVRHMQATFSLHLKEGHPIPEFAIVNRAKLEAARAQVARMTAVLASLAYEPPKPLDKAGLALWREMAREAAREALGGLPTAELIAEEVERGVQVQKDGMAWGLAYADGQVTEHGWIKPTDAPVHDARYVRKPTDVCPGTWTTSGRELHRLDLEKLAGGEVVSIERRTTVHRLR